MRSGLDSETAGSEEAIADAAMDSAFLKGALLCKGGVEEFIHMHGMASTFIVLQPDVNSLGTNLGASPEDPMHDDDQVVTISCSRSSMFPRVQDTIRKCDLHDMRL